MFKGIGQMASLVKQAKDMQERMQEMKENLRRLKVEGTAGGGMVVVTMNGEQQALSCSIEKTLIESGDKELLEDLVVTAINQALERSKEAAVTEMQKITGGLDLSAIGDTLSKLGLGG